MSQPRKPSDHRLLAVILAFAAAGALVFACFSKNWLYNPKTRYIAHEVGFGPLGNFECGDLGGSLEPGAKECRSMSNAKLVVEWKKLVDDAMAASAKDPQDMSARAFAVQMAAELKTSPAFSPFGYITFVACLIAALSLAIGGLLVLAKKRLLLPIMPTTTALLGLMVGLVAGCVFVALKPGYAGYVGVDVGFFAFGGGVVVGIAASLMLNKLMRPEDPDLLADSMDPEHY